MGKVKPTFLRAYKEALLWAIFLLVLFVLPSDELPNISFWEINIEDKLAHVAVFMMLAALMVLGAQRKQGSKPLASQAKFKVFIVCLGYGMLTEAIQGLFIPSRYASLGDVLADGIGAALGTMLAPWAIRITGISVR